MERNNSKKKRKECKKTNNTVSKYKPGFSEIEEDENLPKNGMDESATFRDYYDDFMSSRSETEMKSGEVGTALNGYSDQEYTDVEEDRKDTGKKGKNIKSRRLSRSRSSRRSRSRLSRKGLQRSSSRKNKSRYEDREKSPSKSGSQRRKSENKSNRNSIKSRGNNRFRSLVKTRVWIPKKGSGNTTSNSDITSDSESEVTTDRSYKETENDNSQREEEGEEPDAQIVKHSNKQNGRPSHEDNMYDGKQEVDEAERKQGVSIKKRSRSKKEINKQSSVSGTDYEDMLSKNLQWHKLQTENNDRESDHESIHSSQTYTLAEDERCLSLRFPITNGQCEDQCDEKNAERTKNERKSRKRHKKRKTEEKACMTEDCLLADMATGDVSNYDTNTHSGHHNSTQLHHHDNNMHSVSSTYSNKLAILCAKYDVDSDTSLSNLSDGDSDEDVDSAEALNAKIKFNKTKDSNMNHTAKTGAPKKKGNSTTGKGIENENAPQRRRSVTFSDVVMVTEAGAKETNGDASEEETSAREEEKSTQEERVDQSVDSLQKERDEFRAEMHRLHTELDQFKKQCQKEVSLFVFMFYYELLNLIHSV